MRRFITILLAIALALTARAQFVVDGTERTRVRWNQIKTEDYRFVYPRGCDSLARVYALEWEKWKQPVSWSIGHEPNEAYRRRMPVILHPYLGYSNGMVVWTPRRMEMYTGPQMAEPWQLPWHTLLAIHEQRHVAQMQFVRQRPVGWTSYLFGEAPAGLLSIWYFDPSHFEGDAVAAETGLTAAGRARTADFLEYYRASFDEGAFRNYERWRYGSQRLYTPDYYKVGYLAIGGMRAVYDKPLFMKDYTDWKISYRKQVRRQTGMKLKHAFAGVMATQDSLWKVDDSLRAPFQPMEQVTRPERYYVSFSGLTWSDGGLYARRAGIARDHQLVRIDSLHARPQVLAYTGADSPLCSMDGRLYWAEVIYEPRWEMHSDSGIRYLENGRTKTLAGKGRYFNPRPFDGALLVCKTGHDGASFVVVMDAATGEEQQSFRAPDGFTPFEAVAIGQEIFCAAVSEAGEGIYHLPGFEPVLEPSFVKINHLFGREGKLFFTSDRTGVNELYSLDGAEVVQHTNLKAGGRDFTFGDDGYLYYTALRADGRMVYRTAADSLPARRVNFTERHKYELEDRLSAQEEDLGALRLPSEEEPSVGEPRRYSKLAHAIKVHSWMPFYVDYDEISAMSGEVLYLPLGLGATAFFQNDLNTLCGYVAYGFNPGFMQDDKMPLHTGLVNITYRGLYPVINARFGMNRLDYVASVKSYVPFNLSSDGWTRAIVPVVSAASSRLGGTIASAELRAYSVLPTLNSCYFPHWGIGGSFALTKDMDFEGLLPSFSLYGYMPGITKTQGIGLSMSNAMEPYTTAAGYKFSDVALSTTQVIANYAIPFLSVDWNGLSPVTYIRNFEFIPKGSFTHAHLNWDPAKYTPDGQTSFNIWTAGAAFDVVLGNFWFVPYTFRLGVSASYVWGNPDPTAKPYEIKLVFNTDL